MKNDLPYHRFAVSVSKKIGKAVERNYIKRAMKEWFRLNRHLVNQYSDLWVLVKRKFDRSNAREIRQLYVQTLKRINRP